MDIAVVVISEALIIAGIGVFIGFLMLSTLLNATSVRAIPSFFRCKYPYISLPVPIYELIWILDRFACGAECRAGIGISLIEDNEFGSNDP